MSKILIKIILMLTASLMLIVIIGVTAIVKSKNIIMIETNTNKSLVEFFSISVDPDKKYIGNTENNSFNYQFENFVIDEKTWWGKMAKTFINKDWYQNIATPKTRIVIIWPGQRKEEIIKHIGTVLAWNYKQRERFSDLIENATPKMKEGKYFPGRYIFNHNATPEEVFDAINKTFQQFVLKRYTPEISQKVPLKQALTIASLLEKEADNFDNMREISGVIWNRLFIDMPLQLDASLQYVKGSLNSSKTWWPKVKSSDKFTKSPYNTYLNKGLPPAPIGNPSDLAIIAALNPAKTDCLFYFHDNAGKYYCSKTYEEHKKKIKQKL